MIRILLTFALVAAAAPAAAAERMYSVTDFDRVVVEGPYVVRLTVGRVTSARASGSQAAIDRATIDVTGRTLRIRRSQSSWGGNPGAQSGPLTVELTTRTLSSARLIGPGRLEIERAEGQRIDLTVEGSGHLRANAVTADALSLGLAGAGRLEVAGTAETLTADVQGTGDLDGAGLRAEHATINAVTTGRVALEVTREVTVTALGVGTVEISGRAACTVRGPNAGMVSCARGRLDQR